jgi:hypothetical protein
MILVFIAAAFAGHIDLTLVPRLGRSIPPAWPGPVFSRRLMWNAELALQRVRMSVQEFGKTGLGGVSHDCGGTVRMMILR